MVRGRSEVFIDTGGFIALVHKSDREHERAVQWYNNTKQTAIFYTTNMVVSETYTWLRYHISHSVAVKFLDVMEKAMQGGELKVVQVDVAMEEKARQILKKYSDQKFSYVDATNFVVLDLFGISDVFGYDSHYRTYGKNLCP